MSLRDSAQPPQAGDPAGPLVLAPPASARPGRGGRAGWPLLVTASCLGAALLATWPLAARLTTTIPLGSEEPATVGLFSIWTLWWTANRLAHGLAHYWDAPFFHPNLGVFTYSEPEPLTGLLVAPLWGVGAPPALIHNLALLALLTLNGIFAARVARALALPWRAALLAGVLMVTLPGVAKELGVLNLTPVFGLLWALEGLIRFGRTGTGRAAGWAAAGLVVAYLTCQQYALMFAPFAVAAGVVAWAQQPDRRAAALRLGLAGGAAGLLIGIVAWPAVTLHQELGFTRSEEVVQALSAQPADFLTRPGTSWLPVPPPDFADTAGLFPGGLLLGLAVVGVGIGWRTPSLRRWAICLAVGVGGAALLALGLNLDLVGWHPFATLRLLPGFAELRSAYRFAVLMQMGLVLLAAVGIAAGLRSRWAGLITLLALLAAGENLTLPVPLLPVPLSPTTAWTTWLAAQPAETVVAHIPFPAGVRVADYAPEAWRLFAQIAHQQPMVNGYSGYFPPGYTDFQLDMARNFPAHGLLCQLAKGLGVNTVVVDQSWLADHRPALTAQQPFLQPAYADSQVQIYHLSMTDSACPLAPGP